MKLSLPAGRRRVAFLGVAAIVATLAARAPVGTRLTGLYFGPLPGPVSPPDAPEWKAEELAFRAVDGSQLEGWWFPSTSPGPVKAVVLFAHGNYGHLGKQWKRTAALASRGFHVLMFDYRGFGDSEGTARRGHAREDVVSALAVAHERARPEGLPVVVLGQSMGAALALEALADRDDVAGLVADAPFSSWTDIAALHLAPKPWLEPILRPLLGLSLSATGTEPVDAAPRLRMPVLVIGCEADDITPAFMARAVAEAAGAKLLLLEGAKHPGSRTEEMEQRVIEAEAQFFERATQGRRAAR